MARPSQNKWVLHQVLVTPPKEDCYIFKRPESARWHYFLSIPGEGVERKSTGVQGAKGDSGNSVVVLNASSKSN